MPGIYLAALSVTVGALFVGGMALREMRGPIARGTLFWVVLLTLPMCPAVFFLVRLPLDAVLRPLFSPEVYVWVWLLYAPLTEEPAKLVSLLVPRLRQQLNRENLARYSAAVGLGFGIGEAWLIAYVLAPCYRHLPWQAFQPYEIERLMVCVCHAGLTALALRKGLPWAMLAHLLLNLPILIAPQRFLVAWVPLLTLLSLFYLTRR